MTTISKNALALVVRDMIQSGEDEFPIADLERQAEAAVQRYSIDRPDTVTADVSGDGGKYYPVSSLSAWVSDFSQVRAIEYPAQAIGDDETPQYLEADDWDDDYWDGSTQYIFLPNHAPAATETMRIRYTAPYQFSADLVTIPTADYWAVVYLLASLTCRAIAVKYARTTDAIINADGVDHAGRSERFRQMASDYMRQYQEHLGLRTTADGQSASPQATGAFVDMDTDPTWPTSRRYLFHGRDTR